MDLKDTTIGHLQASPKSLATIAKETGVSPRWLAYLRSGEYEDPGAKRLQLLYTHLTGKELKLVAAKRSRR